MTPEETAELCRLFEKATGVPLRAPPDETPAKNLPLAWLSEAYAASKPHVEEAARKAAERLYYR